MALNDESYEVKKEIGISVVLDFFSILFDRQFRRKNVKALLLFVNANLMYKIKKW
jgi:hypothetical protein